MLFWALDPLLALPIRLHGDGLPPLPSATVRVGALDPGGSSFSTFGTGRFFSVNSGRVYQTDLLKSTFPYIVVISELANASGLASPAGAIEYRALRADTQLDGWLRVGCSLSVDGCYVRSGGNVASPPVVLPAGVTWTDVLPDPSGLAVRHVVTCRYTGLVGTTRLYSTNLVAGATMAGAENFCATLKALDPTGGGSAGYTIDAQGGLRRMVWDAVGASVSGPIHSLTGPTATAVGDSNAAYFLDGPHVVRASGSAAQRIGTLPAPWTASNLIGQTSTRIVVQASGGGQSGFLSISKSDGSVVTLSGIHAVVGVIGSDIVYMQRAPTGGISGNVRRMSDVGGGDRSVVSMTASFATTPTPVLARSQRIDDLRPIQEMHRRLVSLAVVPREISGMVWCDHFAADLDCRRGQLKSIDLATGVVSVLGSFGSGDASNTVHNVSFDGPLHEGVAFTVRESVSGEVFVVRPDVPGSMTRFYAGP